VPKKQTLHDHNLIWTQHWGKSYYSPDTRELLHIPFLIWLERKGEIGPVVFDIGCGFDPISDCLSINNMIVLIDIVAKEQVCENKIYIQYDINKLQYPKNAETQNFIAKSKVFLKKKQIFGSVNTIIMSGLLNYVDYTIVLPLCYKLLAKNGRLVLFNNFYHFVEADLLFKKRLNNVFKLILYLEKLGFGIDSKYFKIVPDGYSFNAKEKQCYYQKNKRSDKIENNIHANNLIIAVRKK
jgi:hypothetical protein